MDLIEKIKLEGDFFEWIHITSHQMKLNLDVKQLDIKVWVIYVDMLF